MTLNFEINHLIEKLKELKPKKVLIQLREGIKQNSFEIAKVFEDLKIEVVFSGETCWGACALAIDEAKHGVRVNAILPAVVVTPLYEEALARAETAEKFINLTSSWHWVGRCATIEEVGKACLFLASDAATHITGTAIPIDGGGSA